MEVASSAEHVNLLRDFDNGELLKERLQSLPSNCTSCVSIQMCSGLNSHCFPMVGEGHQPNSRVLYPPYRDSLLKVGWQVYKCDHGTNEFSMYCRITM